MKQALLPFATLLAVLVSVASCKTTPDKPAAKPDKATQVTPAKAVASPAPTEIAVGTIGDPKPLSEDVTKGLTYLLSQQQDDGGWGQGGGWRNPSATARGGSRIQEGHESYKEISDVGNTSMAALALIRAGSTPSEGTHAKQIEKAVHFVCGHVEKADHKTLFVSDIRGTQIQSKIGLYVDTFLSSMVLAEAHQKMPDKDGNDRVARCLDKVVYKIGQNQKEDGTFEGNRGWASVLSQGLSVKGLNRARQAGAPVDTRALERTQKQVLESWDEAKGDFASGEKAGGSTAGVNIYSQSANLAGMQENVNSSFADEDAAEVVIASRKATTEEKNKAKDDLKRIAKLRKVNADARRSVVGRLDSQSFVNGFGSNGGEEFLSYMNISETLLVQGGKDWKKWDTAMTANLGRVQNADGSWVGKHCITGRTFVTSAALLVLTADRAPVPLAKADITKKKK